MSTFTGTLPPVRSDMVKHQVLVLLGPMPTMSTSTVGIVPIPAGSLIAGGPCRTRLASVAELKLDQSNVLAIHYDIDEYGIGRTPEDALADLLTSLRDYRLSLEKERGSLGREGACRAGSSSEVFSIGKLISRHTTAPSDLA